MNVRCHLLACASILAIVPFFFGQAKDTCRAANLPPGAQVLLNTKYEGWRPKRVSDLGPDDKQLWLKAHPKDCPGIAIGHFENPGQLAYALLLVPKSQSSHGYRIIVIGKTATDAGYAVRVLDHSDTQDSDSGMVVSTARGGSYSDFERTASLKLKLDSVNVEWIEKGAVLYYWTHGQYRTLQTSD